MTIAQISVSEIDGASSRSLSVGAVFNYCATGGSAGDTDCVIDAGNGDGDILYSGRALTVLHRHSIDFGNALTSRQILRSGVVNGVAPGD